MENQKSDIKTEWNLGLLYKSEKDPAIEKDMLSIEKACCAFEKKYRSKDFTSTPSKLHGALIDFELFQKSMLGYKPWWFFTLRTHLNAENNVASAIATKLDQRLSIATNKTTFFSLKISTIPKKEQKKFLIYKPLSSYIYLLKKSFESAQYLLSEKEENLVSLLTQTSYSLWIQAQEKLFSQQRVIHNNKEISLSEAKEVLADLPKEQRQTLYTQINASLRAISEQASAEINAIVSYKKVLDDMRGYEKPYSSILFENENDENTIEMLARTVTKHFSISNRFYKLHTKLLQETSITPADINASIGVVEQTFTYEKTIDIIKDGFKKIGSSYVECFEKFLKNGQIDVYPKKGKMGGGYCWKIGDNPTFILLNHVDTIRSVETLAHEMGHGFHNEFSRIQPVHYQGHPSSTAEVASTFFEQLIVEELEHTLSEKDTIILLHNKIKGDISSIFVQIACFNFETELHNIIREKGKLSKEEIAHLMGKHLKACRGTAVVMNEHDGYHFVGWSHIRMFFYTYTYAFGQLISRAMYEKWKQDPSFEKKVKEFLSAGSSLSPRELFKKMGIDITNPSFFESGLQAINADITKLEKLAKRQN